MSVIYDNWERLVAAALKKQQLWELFHDQSRSPSIRSEASDLSSSFHDFSSSSTFESFAELQKTRPRLVLISEFSPLFDFEDVYTVSSELLGRGTFGSVYKAAMDNGAKIVVKRLRSLVISELEFEQNMEIVGDIKHENVVKLRTYYCSKNEKLMLYDYYSKGSVYELLHGQANENRDHLDWDLRLRISIGAAKGIAEIHAQNGGKLVHGNIKTSNIFLNPEHYGCISDLGLPNTMATAWCYAPEVRKTRKLSQSSDIYSFGILLLELLTGKPAVAVDLVKLVASVNSKKWAAKVFDVSLLTHPIIKEQMVRVLQIGISCVAKSDKRRPQMSAVVKMLEDINITSKEAFASCERGLVFVEDRNPTVELEDLLRANAEVLGKGTFGTSYKAILETGEIFVVKRLKDVIVTFEEFQQHMEVIGRMRHANVFELRAYVFSREYKILVYNYYDQDSVSALLHGAVRTPLNWMTRLKIAVGAARGIAYIHTQDGHKLVHGNIKASNIFLNIQRYGIVSNVGLAHVTSPITPHAGYCAPEVVDTGEVSQASDVYSFGVVLLELISGKTFHHNTGDDGEVVSLVKWIESVIFEEPRAQVFDVELLGYKNDEEAMGLFLQIAMDCVATVPWHRPKMPRVVKMLERIRGIYTVDEPSIDSKLDQLFGKYRLQQLLEGLLPKLTP